MKRLMPPPHLHLPGLVAVACALCVSIPPVAAQQGIYTCIDEHGRHLTSDRPIPECRNLPQRELSGSGTTVRIIPPTPTAIEREQQVTREREAEVRRQRALNALRRDQALFTRYPDPDAHDLGRRAALAQTEAVIEAAEERISELKVERTRLDQELEFYENDPSRIPPKLRFDLDSNAESIEEQRRAIASQQTERDRIHVQFDEEARRLKPMWDAAAANAQQQSLSAPDDTEDDAQ